MSDSVTPSTEAATQWRRIEGNPVPRQQELVTSAVIIADEITGIGPNVSHDEGGRTDYWYRVALAAYELLRETCTYADNQFDTNARCHVDLAAVRAWLTSPAASPDRKGATVADEIGITEHFRHHDPERGQCLSDLLDAAIAAGQLAVPGHLIETWNLAGHSGRLDGHLIIARRPNMTGRASTHLSTNDLVDPDLAGIDAAITALDRTAAVVNDLLDAHPGQTGRPPTPAAAQAFAVLDLDQPSAVPTPPSATPRPPLGRHP